MNSKIALVVALLTTVVFAAEPTTQRAKVRIALAGDSTVTDKVGWGKGFAAQVQGDCEVINFSQGGRSSKSFIDEGHWKKVLAAKPDYVLIQFGHNDQPGKGPQRETDPKTTYPEFLSKYIDDALAINCKPIIVTSIERRRWKDGKIDPTLSAYAQAARKVAEEKKVPLIDMNARTIELYEKLGEKGCEALEPKDPKDPSKLDTTHLNEKGSEVLGKIVADELKKAVPDLVDYLK
jgi:lysophospholipase L1-like esterase